MSIPVVSTVVSNPFTGVFGNGQVVSYLNSGTFVVPVGVSSVRVRVWGGGGGSAGGGGGFALRTITGLISGSSIAVTVGAGSTANNTFGGTSSFGAFCSATGGGSLSTSPAQVGGSGVGGDINSSGGNGGNGVGGGGAGGLFGNGGDANGGSGNAGGGGGSTTGNSGGTGVFGTPGQYQSTTVNIFPTSGMISASIDFFGVGGGGANTMGGINGGGGGGSTNGVGGFPGGGGGGSRGALGLVIVEY